MKLLHFALAASAAFAQAPPARLVTLHVVVTDAQGKRITDLTAADLQVTDQGKPAAITAIRNLAARPAVAPPAAREFTNTPPPALTRPNVILFDLLSINTSSRQPAIDQIVRALEHAEAPDAIYLYVINLLGELVPVHAIPDSPLAPAAPWTREVRPLLERATGSVAATETPMRRDIARRIEITYAAFEQLAARLEPLSGHKNILWLTAGVPCVLQTNNTPWDCRPTLSNTAAKLVRAGVTINPVVLENLANPEITSTYQQFIDFTGGKLYPTADIEKAVGDSLELNRSSYAVQFAPAANSWDGKLHKVRVTSNRKGVNLQFTQAYTADKTSPPPVEEKDRNAALFRSPFDAADIPVSVITSPASQPKTLHLRINLDPRDLQLTPQGESSALKLMLYVAAYLPDDRIQPYQPTPVNAALTPDQLAKMTRDGIHLGNDVLIPDGVRKIRLLVVDPAANRAGTVTIPVG